MLLMSKRPQGGGEDALISVGQLARNLNATTPGRRKGAVAFKQETSQGGGERPLDLGGPVGPETCDDQREEKIVAVIRKPREGGFPYRI